MSDPDSLAHLPPCSLSELEALVQGTVPERIKAEAADAAEFLRAEDAAAVLELMKLRAKRDRETKALQKENQRLKKRTAA